MFDKESVEDFGSKSVSSSSGWLLLDESEDNSERATGNTFKNQLVQFGSKKYFKTRTHTFPGFGRNWVGKLSYL